MEYREYCEVCGEEMWQDEWEKEEHEGVCNECWDEWIAEERYQIKEYWMSRF